MAKVYGFSERDADRLKRNQTRYEGYYINREPKRITWRDANTLVIEPDDARTIVSHVTEGDPRNLISGGNRRAVFAIL